MTNRIYNWSIRGAIFLRWVIQLWKIALRLCPAVSQEDEVLSLQGAGELGDSLRQGLGIVGDHPVGTTEAPRLITDPVTAQVTEGFEFLESGADRGRTTR